MPFTVEKFDYGRHLTRVPLMVLCKESQLEVDHNPLKALGFTHAQIMMDALIGSEESYVFVCTKTRGLLGLFGAAQQVIGNQIVVVPWFLTTGFERLPMNTRAFLRCGRVLVDEWSHSMARGKLMINECLNDKRITKWLRWLGFTVEDDPMKRFVTFVKKGGT